MAGREASRAPVAQAQDPLLRVSQSETSSDEAQLATGGDSFGADGCKTLASKGLWKEVAQQTANYRQAGPDSILEKAAWYILSLAKLRNFPAAAEELKSLGSLDSPEFLMDTAQGTQSRVPFAIRLLACEIPARLGNWRESQDAFYALLDFCTQKAEEELPNADGLQKAHRALWRGREERIVGGLFCQHLRLRDYRAALQWLAWLRQRYPDSLELLSTVGCVQLVIGHIPAAAATFQAISALVPENPGTEETQQRLVRRNRGLMLFAQSDFAGAAAEFDAILAEAPDDYVAANNRAVCRMYGGDLKAAVQSLEGSLRDQPLAMLHEAIISNLASMYELSSPVTSQAAKKNLGAWAVRIAPDDFDLSSLR